MFFGRHWWNWPRRTVTYFLLIVLLNVIQLKVACNSFQNFIWKNGYVFSILRKLWHSVFNRNGIAKLLPKILGISSKLNSQIPLPRLKINGLICFCSCFCFIFCQIQLSQSTFSWIVRLFTARNYSAFYLNSCCKYSLSSFFQSASASHNIFSNFVKKSNLKDLLFEVSFSYFALSSVNCIDFLLIQINEKY